MRPTPSPKKHTCVSFAFFPVTLPPRLEHSVMKVLGNVRACAISYPTRVREGLIWVWASSGPEAESESVAAPWKGLAESLDQDGDAAFNTNHRWYFRLVLHCLSETLTEGRMDFLFSLGFDCY